MQEAMRLRIFFKDLYLTPRVNYPFEMLCDNTDTVQFAKDPKFYQKTKHIKRRYHLVRNAIKTNEFAVKYISTNKMIPDLLTKPIPRGAFKAYALSIGLHGV